MKHTSGKIRYSRKKVLGEKHVDDPVTEETANQETFDSESKLKTGLQTSTTIKKDDGALK